MKSLLFLCLLSVFFTACQTETVDKPDVSESVRFEVPEGFPEPVYAMEKNPVSPAGFALGKALFYEGELSVNGQISCGSCHLQAQAFTHHGHDVSHGVFDRLGNRNSPAIQNTAWQERFFWDGGVHDLDLFSVAPIENPLEMDEKLPNVLEKIRKNPKYPPLFEAAFGDREVTTERFLKSLSQFMNSLISADSPYDRHRLGRETLNEKELAGLELFRQKCATCHAGELFTDGAFRNNGLRPALRKPDLGRALITLKKEDEFKFKTPSLRNVAVTGPYMHDGRFYSLQAVLDHYAARVQKSETLDSLLIGSGGQTGIPLKDEEKEQIIAFLNSLTDETFLNDPRFSEF